MRPATQNTSLGSSRAKCDRLIAAAILLTWAAIGLGVGFRMYATHVADNFELKSEKQLLRNSLTLSRQNMEDHLKSITIRDEAVEKIDNAPDPTFIDENVGKWLADYMGIPISMVVDPANRVSYFYDHGERRPPAQASQWFEEASRLIDKVRQREKAGDYVLIRNGDAFKPRIEVAFDEAHGSVALIGVSTIVPDFARVIPKPGPSALIVTIEPLADGLLRSIARNTLLDNVRFAMEPPTPDTPHIDIAPHSGLETIGKHSEGVILWDPKLPGDAVAKALWEPAIAALVIMLIASLIIYRATRKLNQEILTSQARAVIMARQDQLTSLPNRVGFTERLNQELAGRGADQDAALLYLDVNHLKEINDSMGYGAGDALLVEVGERLKRAVGERGFAARLGGDEFAIYVTDVAGADVDDVIKDLQKALERPVTLLGAVTHITASIGVAQVEKSIDTEADITRRADLALNKARSLPKGTVIHYSDTLDQTVQMVTQLSHDIETSLRTEDFFLLYQPLISADTMLVKGVEALIRWNHPIKGLISPGIFIPAAENTGLIRDLSVWVMRRAFEDSKKWPGVAVSINISPNHMKHPDFLNDVKSALAATDANPRMINLEITEGVLLEDSDNMRNQLADLRQLGCKIVLDDFGTGYSSLDYLHRYSFDRIKIDKSFVQGVDNSFQAPAIIQAVISLSHMSGADVVAEGVETQEQFEFLKEAGCDLIQGFYFFEALPAEDIVELTQGKEARQVA